MYKEASYTIGSGSKAQVSEKKSLKKFNDSQLQDSFEMNVNMAYAAYTVDKKPSQPLSKEVALEYDTVHIW